MYRSHHCGELTAEHIDNKVILAGWVARVRDLGGLVFVTLRDRYGKTQIVFDPDVDEALCREAKRLRMEWVVQFHGTVRRRPEGGTNPAMTTGEIEIVCDQIQILNSCETPPLLPEDEFEPSEEHRLRYRFLDLRRDKMQRNLRVRHQLLQQVRFYLIEVDFMEIETPMLTRSTPEGARDYIVPSRVHPGHWYALPQSPQTYKQILMISGYDRYFQIVRCFRDEDLRANRQPEFTQIDVEMAFCHREDIFEVTEGLMKWIFENVMKIEFPSTIPQMSYDEAIRRFGTDKPDTRFGQELVELSDLLHGHGFGVIDRTVDSGGGVVALRIPGGAGFSRKQISVYEEFVKERGLGGLMPLRRGADGTWSGPLGKFIPAELLDTAAERLQMVDGDLALVAADQSMRRFEVMGMLRLKLAEVEDWIPEGRQELLWITDFPLVAWNEEEKRWEALHHPFTAPQPESWEKWKDQDPSRILSQAYDLVWNGEEAAGGSIRIHDRSMQEELFQLIGMTPEVAQERFSFLLEALQYGAPPHGGIAFGFDRIVMQVLGEKSIRDVIAFPKTTAAVALFEGAPSKVMPAQLAELHLIQEKE